MKDELPDLTPYLSKKGGNSQSKGSDNPPGKADISSKLSALVKKTGSFNAVSDEANADAEANLVASDDSLEAPISHEQSYQSGAATGTAPGSSPAAASSAWANIGAEAQAASAPAAADNKKEAWMVQNPETIDNRQDTSPEPSAPYEQAAQPASGSSSSSWEQIDSFSASARTDIDKEDEFNSPPQAVNESAGTSSSGASGFGASGTFSTRPGARPGAGLDKFKAPQARPMNTLSSGASPVLKTPPKEPGRAPAPYGFAANEAPKSAPAKPTTAGQPASVNASSSGSNIIAQPAKARTGEQTKDVRKEDVRKEEARRADPPPSWPAQPTSPPRVTEKVEPQPAPVKAGPPTTTPFSQPSQTPPPSAPPAAPVESEAQILARAFMEEAKALEAERPETRFEDHQSAPAEAVSSTNLGALFAAEKLSESEAAGESSSAPEISPSPSPYMMDDEAPKRSLGFGNLLATAAADPSQSSKHSTLADLMVPTGEHQTLFAPDRRTEQGEDQLSPFDEVPAQPSDEPIRLDNSVAASAPAFSALFSTEIVTSGDDFSKGFPPQDNDDFNSGGDLGTDQFSFGAEPVSAETPMASRSDVISKLMEAVNQPAPAAQSVDNAHGDSDMPDDFSGNFANNFTGTGNDAPNNDFTTDNFPESNLDDMRTADTMFGSGGSNKGSHEELAAADAVFGAVADLGAPAESEFSAASTDFNSEPKFETSSQAKPEAPVPVLDIDALPMAFGDSTNFEQIRLEDIKAYKKAAKLKAAEEARAAEAAKNASAGQAAQTDNAAEAAPKLSLTEMIDQANAAKLEQVNDKAPEGRKPAGAQSSLSSLLAGGDDLDEVAAPAANTAPDEDEEDSLGGAISDALDKLLNDAQPEGDTKSSVVSGGLSKLLSNSSDQSQRDLVAPAAASAATSMDRVPAAADEPMTNTQANKVDALSRLLEVASKAPHKSAEDKRRPSDSASKLAAEINKPPGKISRQVDVLSAPDYLNQGKNAEPVPPSFGGGPSPFTSPFTSPSATHNRQASQGADPLPTNPYASPSEMPQATISNDAVSARIAALNRKLEEGSRSPTASAMNIEAMNQAQSQSQMGTATGTGSSPSVNSLSQLPSQVDDSPSTRAELVNRILGSAKISQHGTKIPDTASRTVADAVVSADQVNAIRSAKGAKPGRENAPNRPRARVSRMPGFDPRPLIAIAIVLCVLGGGGYYAIQNNIIKLNFPAIKPSVEAKLTVDQMIKSGDLDRAREVLEAKVKSGKITNSEAEKLYNVYYQQADKIGGDDASEALKLLDKIPSRSKKYKDAQKLVRKLKKKVKKN